MVARGMHDWVAAALEALAQQGAEGVRVEALATQLKVTKGSFYWHFKDRAALLEAMLGEWERLATTQVIVALEPEAAPKARLQKLLRLAARHPRAARTEQAIRAWGAREPAAREALTRVDARREAYVKAQLVACGVSPARAARRSHALYLMLIGEYARVSHGGAPSPRETWDEQVELATGPAPSGAGALEPGRTAARRRGSQDR
jgi:AcrR family transcriptional regulator